MSEEYDVIVAGAGHNGLTAAAYLARAGLSVCVVERQPYVGGGVITQELNVPGFKFDYCSTLHGLIQLNPLMQNDELGLKSKYGLSYIHPEAMTGCVFDDGSSLVFYRDIDRTCESIARFSSKDAERYREFYNWSASLLDMLGAGLSSAPPSFASMAAMMDESDVGRTILRAQMLSGIDVVNEWFENEKVRIAIARYPSESMINPFVKGTGFSLFIFIPLAHKYGWGIPVGGSGQLSEALVKCLEDMGGVIRVSSTIKKFKIENGETKGVILEDGGEILAKRAVVTNFNVMQVFPSMVEGAELPPDFVTGIKNLEHSNFMPMNQHLALNEVPRYKVEDVNDAFWVERCHSSMEEFAMEFQKLQFGHPSSELSISIVSSMHDKTRAPEGKHTLYLYSFEPYDLKDGGAKAWDEKGEEIADGVLENMREVTTNMGDENILGRTIVTPLDFERHNLSYVKGDFAHFGMFMHQMGSNRPLCGYQDYRMPVKNLYLTGPSAHPGMGVNGNGRGTAQIVMEDLGIDFE